MCVEESCTSSPAMPLKFCTKVRSCREFESAAWNSIGGTGGGERMDFASRVVGRKRQRPYVGTDCDFGSVAAQGGDSSFLCSIFSREISGVLAHQQETGSELRLLAICPFSAAKKRV